MKKSTPHTQEEICNALNVAFPRLKFTYKHNGFYGCTVTGVHRTVITIFFNSNKITIDGGAYPPHLITMIGEFYEECI